MSLRNKDERDMRTLERIEREGGFSLSWLISNRDNAASLQRIVASGAARFGGSDWISCRIESEEPKPGSIVEIPSPKHKTWSAAGMLHSRCLSEKEKSDQGTKMRSVLITGGSGFFGRGFVRTALDMGAERICIYSRGEYAQSLMRQEIDDRRCRWFIGDVRDRDRLIRAMEGVDLVVHAAALKRVEVGEENPEEMEATNVGGAVNVIAAARSCGVYKVVALSTDKAYDPANKYGETKQEAERRFLRAHVDQGGRPPLYAVCRYGNVAGSTGSVIPIWRAAMARGQEVEVRDPEATRFWMTRDEAVALVVNTATTMRGRELAIPDLPAYRLGDLAEAMGVKYRVTRLQPGEKQAESMDATRSSDKARRMTVNELKEALHAITA